MTLKRTSLLAMVLLACSAVVTGGCGGEKSDQEAKAPMTQTQRDSVMAASKLPGAGVVGKALTTADSAEARAKRLNESADD